MTDHTINLTGWTHVHTWHESHGDHSDAIYQREPTAPWSRRVELLTVSTYRDGRPTGIRVQVGEQACDYLMARDLRANPARYVQGAHNTTPCSTAGSDDFEDSETGQRWRIFGAAGHGEWAFKLDDGD